MSSLKITKNDLKDLPEELISQLMISRVRKHDANDKTLSVIKDLGGEAIFDAIMIEYYKKYGEIIKQHTMISRLYRLVKNKSVFSDPMDKNKYSLKPYN